MASSSSSFECVSSPDLRDTPDIGDRYPKILLMGLRRSGKTSIKRVVFNKMPPNETLFLKSTTETVKDDVWNSDFVQFSVWDLPGAVDFFDPEYDPNVLFKHCVAIVFVIDSQDDYDMALETLKDTVVKSLQVNSRIVFAVFFHKIDIFPDESKLEAQRDITQTWNDICSDHDIADKVNVSFFLTSIYDQSVFESFSKVIQKLNRYLSFMEKLLDIFSGSTMVENVFLIDVVCKLFIATDSNPVDIQSYEICCDMIDVLFDISCIYGGGPEKSGEDSSTSFDSKSSCTIKLHNGTVLVMEEVSRYLGVICVMKKEIFKEIGSLKVNMDVVRRGIQKLLRVREEFSAKRKEVEQTNESQRANGNGQS